MDDQGIIELYWARDERAIAETDVRYGDYVFRIAYNLLGDRSDSEECQSDTYLGLWNAIPPERPEVLRAFITRIVRFVSINRYKERMRKKRIPSELTLALEDCAELLSSGADEPEAVLEANEISRIINEFLRELPRESRFIFVCRYYFADPVKLIARRLGLSESSVFKKLAALREELSGRLNDYK